MASVIDLNCDMGESYGRWTLGADEAIMPYITSANIACGFHGGDPHVIRKTVALALEHGVALGAHPSLPDLMGFGRRVMDVTPAELQGLHLLPDRRGPRVLPGGRRRPPARQAPRHPLHDGRAAGRRSRTRSGRRRGSRGGSSS